MTKICHISTAHYSNDDRIFYKECISLEQLGYEVFFIVKSPENEIIQNIRLIAIPEYNNRISRILLGPIKAWQIAKKIDAEIYHFHDPELIPVGFKLKALGKKVIFDVHEIVYYQLENKKWLGPLVKLVQKIYLLFERRAVKKFNGIISAADSIQEYFSERYPSFSGKFELIRNYSILSLIDSVKPAYIGGDEKKLIYLGGLSRIRGIKEIIQALAFMDSPPVFILFGLWEEETYKNECMSMQGWKQVRYMGFKKLEEIYPYLKSSDLTIAMLYPRKNYLTSLPVKAFEYMAMCKPMILSDFPYWKETFGNCAIFVNPLNPNDIAEKIAILLNDEPLRKKLGENGRKAVEERFSWEAEAVKLADFYANILSDDNKTH